MTGQKLANSVDTAKSRTVKSVRLCIAHCEEKRAHSRTSIFFLVIVVCFNLFPLLSSCQANRQLLSLCMLNHLLTLTKDFLGIVAAVPSLHIGSAYILISMNWWANLLLYFSVMKRLGSSMR